MPAWACILVLRKKRRKRTRRSRNASGQSEAKARCGHRRNVARNARHRFANYFAASHGVPSVTSRIVRTPVMTIKDAVAVSVTMGAIRHTIAIPIRVGCATMMVRIVVDAATQHAADGE
jgi:hypothetical protein